MFKTMLSILLPYLLVLLAVFLLQRQLIYFPEKYTPSELELKLAHSALKPWPSAQDARGLISDAPIPKAKATVLVFHGNAGSAADRGYYVAALQRLGYRVILAEYPGYGARMGAPSKAALVSDGVQTAKLVAGHFNEPLFLCGESLGGGVAAEIIRSKQVKVEGLLLITPFASLAGVARHHYWFFLAHWLLLDPFDNIDSLRGYSGNTAVIMAGTDEVVPKGQTLALFESLGARKKLWRFDKAGHNTLPMDAEQPWWREVMLFLDD